MLNIEYLKTIDQFPTKKVLVVGDCILDVYLKGVSTRLSPEAPVPVVDVIDKIKILGGAANTAVNLLALGADVSFLTVVGTDDEGVEVIQMIEDIGIKSGLVLSSQERKTLVKTRVMSGAHVVTRYDSGTESPITAGIEQIVIQQLKVCFGQYDAIVISDYNKGVITRHLIECLAELQALYPKFIVVDSKRLHDFEMLAPALVKPNYEEALKLLHLAPQGSERAEQIIPWGEKLYELTGACRIAVTLDAEGAIVFEEGKFVERCVAHAISLPQVSGAGDTFISAGTLAFISGADIKGAIAMANEAAAIAIKKDHTASCSMQELKGVFAMHEKHVFSWETLAQLCDTYKAQGKRIVFTNGCFDILHSGHVSYLNRAKQLGDILIVGINTDDSIRRLKGPKRPINPLEDRMQVLAGLSSINHIVAFGDAQSDTPVGLIKVVKPDVFVKGGDYTRDKLPEADTVEEVGGEIIFLSLVPDHSTTQIIQQIYKTSTLAVA